MKFYEVTYKYVYEESIEVPNKKGEMVEKIKLKKANEKCLIYAKNIQDAETKANEHILNNTEECADEDDYNIVKIAESKIKWVHSEE